MSAEMSDIVVGNLENYDHEKFQRRRNSLTNDDLDGIYAIVEAVLKQHAGCVENCRFNEITPDDLKAVVEAHKNLNAALKDSKTVVRRFIILAILGGMSGIAFYGWWAKVVDNVKKAMVGN